MGSREKNEHFRPYAQKLGEMLESLLIGVEPGSHPLLVPRDEVNSVGLILLTADRGLCGSFNLNLIASGERFIKEQRELGPGGPNQRHRPQRGGIFYGAAK